MSEREEQEATDEVMDEITRKLKEIFQPALEACEDDNTKVGMLFYATMTACMELLIEHEGLEATAALALIDRGLTRCRDAIKELKQ